MTISSAVNRMDYTGASSTATYSYTFRIFDDDDLTLTVRNPSTLEETTLVKTTDYTVTGVTDLTGGTIVLVNASQAWLTSGNLTTSWHLTIRRVRDLVQETDIRNQGDFFPETHEDAFDGFVMIDQQQQEEIDRSLRIPSTYSGATISTTLPAPSAGKILGWNDDADALENLASADNISISTFGESLVAATTAAAARTVLDVSQAINSLTAETAPATGDFVPLRDISEPADNKITLANVFTIVNAFTEDTTPAVDDYFLSYDTSAAAAKKVAPLNIRKSYIRSVVTTDSAVSTDDTFVLSGASFTQTLFTAVGFTGRRLTFIHAGTDISQIYTIDGNASETIGGSATTTLDSNGEVLEIISNGTNWLILRRYIPSIWQTYTPTFAGLGTVASLTSYYQRVGDSINIVLNGTTGTVTGSTITISLPSGITVSQAKWSTTHKTVGRFERNTASGTTQKMFSVKATGPNAFLTLGSDDYTTAKNPSADSVGSELGSTEGFTLFAHNVSITGWNG